jgi:hypothetical protein
VSSAPIMTAAANISAQSPAEAGSAPVENRRGTEPSSRPKWPVDCPRPPFVSFMHDRWRQLRINSKGDRSVAASARTVAGLLEAISELPPYERAPVPTWPSHIERPTGVTWSSSNCRWQALQWVDGRRRIIASARTPEELLAILAGTLKPARKARRPNESDPAPVRPPTSERLALVKASWDRVRARGPRETEPVVADPVMPVIPYEDPQELDFG